MHWGYFFKGSVFSLFLVLTFLTTASLIYQFYPQKNIVRSRVIAENYGNFPTVLGASVSASPKIELQPVNILLLGLDSRKGDKSARCDAIHMFSFKPDENKIIITSVPRGTMVTADQYISNYCSIYGFAVAQKEIERITGVKADYVVKVGFSQVDGLLRLVNLPPSPTLQFLRDRKDYLIGDNQRSYNQATFLKDAIVSYTDWGSKLPEPMQYLAYKIVDTDIPYDKAQEFFKMFLASGVYKDPNNIEIVVKPGDGFVRQDIHVTSKVSTDSAYLSDPEFINYQNDVTSYLGDVISRANYLIDKRQYAAANTLVTTPLNQRLWLQIENESDRNQLHFNLIETFVYSSTDHEKSKALLNDFILEMDQAGKTTLKTQAEDLLKLL